MDTDGDGTVTKEVRYLIQILNSRCPIHILLRIQLKLNTALLSTVRVFVCHRRDISTFLNYLMI